MTRTRFRRFATGALALGVGAALVVAGVWYLPSASLVPGHSVSWKLGYMSERFDAATAMTTTVIPIEALHPTCTTDDAWFETLVTYTPISVTIQVRMKDAAAATCPWPDPRTGLLPAGSGWFTSGLYIPVHLREPLAGRALFDGSSFPAAARPYP